MEERLKALKLAMEREAEAKAFYLEASRKMTNDFAQDMFQSLARDEERHLRTVKAVFDRLSKERAWPKQVTSIGDTVTVRTVSLADVRSIEVAAKKDLDVSRGILKLGIEREEWSMEFYHELAEKATDPFEKRFFIALEHEERGHYLTLWDYREFLEDPEGWFNMKEGFRLDAG
ncbi:MAG: ferritin family protein [Methanomicrobia archaeon]|nr:ferritin family protein [Methanomicrobia archaeon]